MFERKNCGGLFHFPFFGLDFQNDVFFFILPQRQCVIGNSVLNNNQNAELLYYFFLKIAVRNIKITDKDLKESFEILCNFYLD